MVAAESLQSMKNEGEAALSREGVAPDEMGFLHQADMRYVGQSYELTVPLSDGELAPAGLAGIVDRFHMEHERAYGFRADGEPVEFVALRLSAIGGISRPRTREISSRGRELATAFKTIRSVYFAESEGFADCRVYDRYKLPPDAEIRGPAIVEEVDSTTVIHPGYRALVDRSGNLLLSQ